jgi:hypothetical protein
MHSTLQPPVSPPEQRYLVTAVPSDAYRYFATCPNARTLVAYSFTHGAQILFSLPCRTWSCRPCAEVKIKKLAVQVQQAEPNRLLTLTVNPALYSSRKEAWEETRREVPILIRRLRKRFGDIEYLRVTEVTRKGWPHYHLLVRSAYLPHSVVKDYWAAQTGATIVDIRQVKKSFSAYKYLVKYLAKLHRLEWTERHVSMSKKFAPDFKSEQNDGLVTAEPEFIQSHPTWVVLERFQGATLQRVSPNAHLILHHQTKPKPPYWQTQRPLTLFPDSP